MLTLSLVIATLCAVLVGYLMYRSDKNRNTPLPGLSAGLRAVLTFLCVLLILAPKISRHIIEEQKPLAVFLQDHSESAGKALDSQQSAFNKNRKALLSKLSDKFRVLTWNLDGPVPADSLSQYSAAISNLGKPIDELITQFGQQNLAAVIVASDGNFNEGNNPIYSNFPLSTFVYTVALGDTARIADARVGKLYANKTVSLNSDWELMADIVAENINAPEIQVDLHDETGKKLGSTTLRSQDGNISRQLTFPLKATSEGLHQYTVRVNPVSSESNVVNNRNTITVQVLAEKKKILLVYAAPHPDIKAISAALQGHKQYELELREFAALPLNTEAYSAIILHQLPAAGKKLPAGWTKGKNIWYFAGGQTDNSELNRLQQTTRFTAGMSRPTLQVAPNKSFSLFNTPPDLPAVSDQLPPLQTAGEISAYGSAQVLFTEQEGRPLWSITAGNPATAVTAGEGIWRWRLYEYKNFGKQSCIDDCILQTLNLLSNAAGDRRFRVASAKSNWSSGEQIIMNAWLNNAAGASINTPEVSLNVKDSSGKTLKFTLERSGNRYQLNIGALAAGTYNYAATVITDGKTFTDAGRFFVNETNIELLDVHCNLPLLFALAKQNKGQTFGPEQMDALFDSISKNSAIKPVLMEREEAVDLISRTWLFFLILALATTEWLLRKYWMAM